MIPIYKQDFILYEFPTATYTEHHNIVPILCHWCFTIAIECGYYLFQNNATKVFLALLIVFSINFNCYLVYLLFTSSSIPLWTAGILFAYLLSSFHQQLFIHWKKYMVTTMENIASRTIQCVPYRHNTRL